MYVVVVGAGQIGSQVIDLLTRSGTEIVVVEIDAERAEAVSREYDCLVLNADATVKETLEDAGTDRADAVITTTDQDATNIMVMLLAGDFDVASKVSVVQNHEHMQLFRRIGVNVLENPQRLIAEYLVRAVQRPSVKDFMTLADDAEVFEIIVSEEAPIAGRTLIEADADGLLDEDILVVALERDDEVHTPRGNTTVEVGDLATVFSKRGITPDVMRVFTGHE